MFKIEGTLQVMDPAIGFTRWELMLIESQGFFEDETIYVETSGTDPTPYSFEMSYGGFPVYLLARPAFDRQWQNQQNWAIGTILQPKENPTTCLYQLTETVPINNDPHWSDVVVRITGSSGYTDDKGHAIEKGSSYPSNPTGYGSYPSDYQWNAITTGSFNTWPDSNAEPLKVDHADLNLGTGDFTIQVWYRYQYYNTPGTVFCLGTPGSGTELILEGQRFQPLNLWYGSTKIATLSNLGSEWERAVLCRENGTLKVWKGANLEATVELAGTVSGPLYLLGLPDVPHNNWAGNVADFVITKGIARQAETPIQWKVGSLGPQPSLTGSTEPSWPTTKDATVQDGGVIWKCLGPQPRPILEGPLWSVEIPDA